MVFVSYEKTRSFKTYTCNLNKRFAVECNQLILKDITPLKNKRFKAAKPILLSFVNLYYYIKISQYAPKSGQYKHKIAAVCYAAAMKLFIL